ncbi:MAG: acyltransferase [Chitinispirillaceae bacterium]|nr:acyltransferase [Chitinispirillaceae bacterium]
MTSVRKTYFGQSRYDELDALRGIAALSVVLWHFVCATYTVTDPGTKSFVMSLYFLVQGRAAVILFFILSGFVLSLPFFREPRPGYGGFVVRRICRIYLPYIALIACTILVRTFVSVKKLPGLSDWFNDFCGDPFSLKTALEHLFLIGNINIMAYNNPVWSLIHEMRISLLFPLLFLFVLRVKPMFSILACFVLTGVAILNEVFGWETSKGWQTGYFYTLQVTSFFIVGILLARYKDHAVRWYRALKKWKKIMLLIVSCLLFRYSMELWLANIKLGLMWDYGSVVGACGLMVIALGSVKAATLLRKPGFKFFGNISYSMYLNHITMLYLSFFLLYGTIPVPVILLVYIVLVIVFSSITWKAIELPSIALGRIVSDKLKRQ